eukprot:GHVU01129457.1.p1 GENE.GHVU01129457.1~~GHVU01129457.1.p1  ORF type:complete len:194 (+),score=21.83 GHVU01129457.1:74-583(+)
MGDTVRVEGRRDRRNKGGQSQVASTSAEDSLVSVAPRFDEAFSDVESRSEIEREVSDVGRPQPKGASPQKPPAAKGRQKTYGFISTDDPRQRLEESDLLDQIVQPPARKREVDPGTRNLQVVDERAKARASITGSDPDGGIVEHSDIESPDLSEATSYQGTQPLDHFGC